LQAGTVARTAKRPDVDPRCARADTQTMPHRTVLSFIARSARACSQGGVAGPVDHRTGRSGRAV